MPPKAPPARSPQTKKDTSVLDTAVLQRNFTLNVEQRIAAIVNGPPAWSVRLRRIEDLESKLAQALEDVGEGELPPLAVERALARLNALIADHNRYYPVEANLAMDVTSGRMMVRGVPWEPRPKATLESLRAASPRGLTGS